MELTFIEEFEILKNLETLGFEIKSRTCYCECGEIPAIDYSGSIIISLETIAECLYISNMIQGMTNVAIHPFIMDNGKVQIRFRFNSHVTEEFKTKDHFDISKMY